MVLESMMNPKNAEDKPLHVFVIAIFYTFIAVFFSYFLFPSQSSVLSVAMITIIFVPFFQKLFELEEEKEDAAASMQKKGNMLSRHARAVYVYTAFFFGVVAAMSFIFITFENFDIFTLQSETLRSFGQAAIVGEGTFSHFFFNNTQVLLLTFILSILFGSGAILILAWNASVIAVYAGVIAKTVTTSSAEAYLFGVPVALSNIALHGIPEILAYFVAGLAGGILSVGIIHEKFISKNFHLIFKDSVKFMLIAEVLILLAAFIESV